jgi:queuine tRNA-ribosyltransferase
MLGPILVSLHNLTFYQRLLAGARTAIAAGRYAAFADDKLRGLGGLEI